MVFFYYIKSRMKEEILKPGCFYSIVSLILFCTFVLCSPGCLRPVGKCTYNENPPETGAVKVKAVEKLTVDGKLQYKVKVEGFFKRDFIFEESEFNKCFKAAGYREGSELEGSVLSGGPCPPLYNLNICRDK